ncbi:iron chaperone [Tabrizicola oligotrophica]|uniref:DUF1801 domain-containing protein n=1 Tax=Tabrizicola oligotrophica TaxID=2710650 RepID=A0A6M0QNC9_9RHOB|nr:DUF1801 domain-containing protein [Tabrizicola oligotrophica]NEY88696.1 DUF1801 domain-containing protein [Tabrizicola oligotrophica]
MTGRAEVDAYIAAQSPAFAAALTALRARLRALLPDHVECLSYAMPGFRQPGAKGRMVVGYAAFTHHLGLYPHSGSVIPQIDCAPFKTSKSGVLFSPDTPLPDALLTAILAARAAELVAARARKA